MRKAILLITILLITFSAKSQVAWNPGFIKALEKFYFIPVEFEHFGNWIEYIENDTSLIFRKKEFTLTKDSLHLDLNIQRRNFPSPFNNSSLSVNILGFTRNYANRVMRESTTSFSFNRLPPQKVTTLYIISKITFDATEEGKLLATQAMKELEKEFSTYFDSKRINKSIKNIRRRKHHPEVNKQVVFSIKENPAARFWINNSTFPERNEIAIYIAYELN